ncbi:MAG: glycosyltransferase family 9 protein [Bacteroidales bacterium]|nr:glycosyltransferase family 9 protein [Bacteroidales bacterium]
MAALKKILIIRFSSIGDIVLTTPVVRCLKKQLDAEIHYLTKKRFATILNHNPYIDKLWAIERKIDEVTPDLKTENFDHIIDLHKNFRSYGVRMKLRKPSTTFPKINFQKWLLTNFKIDRMPEVHIVDRYFKATEKLGISNDQKGLNYFIPEDAEVDIAQFGSPYQEGFIALVIGGKHHTKIFPMDKLSSVIQNTTQRFIILGGTEDRENGELLRKAFPGRIYNACGELNLDQSASVIQQARKVITNDTGLMHIAAALEKNILSIWGNTVPELGMYPYLPENSTAQSEIAEVKGLSCRPCSKIGYEKCPKGHFKCMKLIDEARIARFANR